MSSDVRLRKTMSINPLITTNFIDSCAFDPKYAPEHKAALEIFKLSGTLEILLEISHSTKKEIEHPKTPSWVKQKARSLIYTNKISKESGEYALLDQIKKVIAGNGKIENIQEDAEHIFECQKYGSYFITTDGLLLKRKDALQKLCAVDIVKPSEFLLLVEKYRTKKSLTCAAPDR